MTEVTGSLVHQCPQQCDEKFGFAAAIIQTRERYEHILKLSGGGIVSTGMLANAENIFSVYNHSLSLPVFGGDLWDSGDRLSDKQRKVMLYDRLPLGSSTGSIVLKENVYSFLDTTLNVREPTVLCACVEGEIPLIL